MALRGPGEWKELKGPETELLSVSGKTLIPGLIDSHNHMTLFGQYLEAVEVSPAKVMGMPDLVARLRARGFEFGHSAKPYMVRDPKTGRIQHMWDHDPDMGKTVSRMIDDKPPSGYLGF